MKLIVFPNNLIDVDVDVFRKLLHLHYWLIMNTDHVHCDVHKVSKLGIIYIVLLLHERLQI